MVELKVVEDEVEVKEAGKAMRESRPLILSIIVSVRILVSLWLNEYKNDSKMLTPANRVPKQ